MDDKQKMIEIIQEASEVEIAHDAIIVNIDDEMAGDVAEALTSAGYGLTEPLMQEIAVLKCALELVDDLLEKRLGCPDSEFCGVDADIIFCNFQYIGDVISGCCCGNACKGYDKCWKEYFIKQAEQQLAKEEK